MSENLYRAWVEADRLWSVELQKAFGRKAGDARYVAAGRGEAGSALRQAHDGFKSAQEAWYNSKAVWPLDNPK